MEGAYQQRETYGLILLRFSCRVLDMRRVIFEG